GNLTYDGTAPNSGVRLVEVEASTVGGALTVTSGAGADNIQIIDNSVIGGSVANATAQSTPASINLTLGGGANVINFQSSIDNGHFVTNDAGQDTVTMTNGGANNNFNRVSGFVSLNNTGASSTSNVTVQNASDGTFLS